MKEKRIGLEYRGKTLEVSARQGNLFGKIRGLTFRKRQNAPVLLFEFKEKKNIALHSFFVFFPFVVLWLDDKNRIIDFQEVFPWKISIKSNKKFRKILEVPINKKNWKLLEELHDLLRR